MALTLYSLSTCVHCRQVKQFLEENQVAFTQVLVDKLEAGERKSTLEEIKKHNPRVSFPTAVYNNGEKVVIGNHKDKLQEFVNL